MCVRSFVVHWHEKIRIYLSFVPNNFRWPHDGFECILIFSIQRCNFEWMYYFPSSRYPCAGFDKLRTIKCTQLDCIIQIVGHSNIDGSIHAAHHFHRTDLSIQCLDLFEVSNEILPLFFIAQWPWSRTCAERMYIQWQKITAMQWTNWGTHIAAPPLIG